ncbi:MAG: efflux RND transporter periplasmic adaptor subunit [Oscillospiraceae bacterium]|nr:efflux RND transporter periplasmic adaptor subunit [Oscillospiraceae bacterium]
MAKSKKKDVAEIPNTAAENEENAFAEQFEENEEAPPQEGFSGEEDDDVEYAKYEKEQKKKRRKKIIIIGAAGLVVLLIAGIFIIKTIIDSKNANQINYTDVAVSRQTISNTITGSSYVEPNDSYSVMTMTSGEITADYFSEGDTVSKDDKLYQFEDDDAQDSVTQAENSLLTAQQNYADAVRSKSETIQSNSNSMKSAQNSLEKALISLNEAQDTVDDQYVTADFSGKVSSVSVKEGDEINNSSAIATIYDDSTMKIRLPFNEYDAAGLYVGAAAEVSVVGTGETIYGTVTDVSNAAVASSSNTMVIYATIEVTNPGALDEDDTGSAVVNGVACADTAKFEYKSEKTITSNVSGTVKNLYVDTGSSVYAGQQIAYVYSESAENSLKSAQLSYSDAILSMQNQVLNDNTYSQDSQILSAQVSLENAQLNLKQAQEKVEDYTVTSPIDGTVVTKNAKAGDTIDSSNSSEALCVIYDLSCIKLFIEVDETEVGLVKVGQKATVTASTTDDVFEGEVIKVPVDGTYSNGVTTYLVEIQVDEYGDLLPGMNVDVAITVEESIDTLVVPLNAVNSGDIVFVKDTGKTYENDVTDLLNAGADAIAEAAENAADEKSDGKDSKNDEADSDAEPSASGTPERGERGERGGMPNTSGAPEGDMPEGGMPLASGAPDMNETGDLQAGTEYAAGASEDDEDDGVFTIDYSSLPRNLEVPDGYRAVVVELGINDDDYIEILSGLDEGDEVRTLDTMSSSAGASFGGGNSEESGLSLPISGGMFGGMGGGMSGGGMGGGMR